MTFPPDIFFLFQDPITLQFVVTAPSPLLVWDSVSDFPCFWWPWQFWGIPVGHFVECPSIWVLLMPFSSSDWHDGFLGEDHRGEVPFFSRLIKHMCYRMTYHCWHWPWWPGWGSNHQASPPQIYSPHPHHKLLFAVSHRKQPTLQGWGAKLHFLGGRSYINTIVVFNGVNLSWHLKKIKHAKWARTALSCLVVTL